MRSALLDLTPIIPVTACHQRNYVETYSRCRESTGKRASGVPGRCHRRPRVVRRSSGENEALHQSLTRGVCLRPFQEAHGPAPVGTTRTDAFLEVPSA